MTSVRLRGGVLFIFGVLCLGGCLGAGNVSDGDVDSLLQACATAVIDRISVATTDTVFVEEGGLTDANLQTIQWRLSTTTVSGRCLFDEAGEFVEFIRQ